MKKLALGVIALALAFSFSVASADSYNFQTNLTVGSRGADVSSLQTVLISGGYLTAVTAPTGYFGSATKAALAKWQTAKGISPAVGYFGPLSRAALNGTAMTGGTSTVAGCVAGAAFSSTTGAPCASTSTGITTPGVEGTLSLTSSNAGLASSIYEGDSKVGILGLKLEAKTSDISVQRVKLDLGTATAIYNKVLSKIYVLDGSTVLASADLNSSTVVKEGSNYYITLTGFNALVKKDTTKVLTVAVDVRSSVDSAERSVSRTIQTVGSAVRGVDGAGIDQYTTASAGTVSKSFTISATLADSATLKTSLNSSSPKATTVIASAGSLQNEADKVSALVFNVKAEKDTVLINDLTISATGTAVAAGQITTAYLFDGSTELDNTSVNSTTGLATFQNLDLSVSKDSTKTLTVKVDVRNATTAAKTLTVSIDGDTTATIDAENSIGDSLADGYLSGSATGEQLNVQKAGAVYSLVGTPTLTKSAIGNTASSSFLASFVFDVAANGSDLTVASTSAFVVGIYVNNSQVATVNAVYSKPTSGVTQTSNGPYTIADGATARFTAEYGFVAPAGVYTPAGAIVNARLESAATNIGTATYISDTFRTGSQTL